MSGLDVIADYHHLSWDYCTGASLVHHVMSVSQSDGENEAEVVRKNVAGFIVM